MISPRLNKTIASGLLVAVAFTALAHGAVEAWSTAVFESLILCLMFLWVVKCVLDKRVELKIPLTAYPIGAFLMFGLIQSIALTDGSGNLISLSSDIEATRYAVKVIFFLFVAHLIAANFLAAEERLPTLIKFLTIFGFALAVFGLVQYFAGNSKLYWIKTAPTSASWVHGPFVNHNHFAGYMELIIPIPVALALTGALKEIRPFLVFAAAVMTIATIATASRGGIIGLTGGLLFTLTAVLYYARRKKSSDQEAVRPLLGWRNVGSLATIIFIIAAIFVGTLWVKPDVNRLIENNLTSNNREAETFESSRGWIWRNSLHIFQNNPVFGAGLGTFETVLPKYSESFPAAPNGKLYVFERSHNDYLQILADTGLVGGAIALWFMLIIIYIIKQSLRFSRAPFDRGVTIGSGAAVISLLIHSIFDFNLQITSTALLFLVLTAVSSHLSDTNARKYKQKRSGKTRSRINDNFERQPK